MRGKKTSTHNDFVTAPLYSKVSLGISILGTCPNSLARDLRFRYHMNSSWTVFLLSWFHIEGVVSYSCRCVPLGCPILGRVCVFVCVSVCVWVCVGVCECRSKYVRVIGRV